MGIDYDWLQERIFHRLLTEDEKTGLEGFVTIESFPTGCPLVIENEQGGALYLLRRGEVDVVMQFNGETVRLSHAGEGAQLGDMTFLDEKAASATLIARKDCVAYKITRQAFADLLASRQDVARDLLFNTLANMAGTIRQMNFSHAATTQYIQGRRV